MKVAFMVGKNSANLISSMSKSVDNVEFFTYPGIHEMIRESILRHVFFDRILFSENIVKDVTEDLHALNEYVKEYSDNTSIVAVCKDGSSPIIGEFNKLFNSPLYTPVISNKVTTVKLIELSTADVLAIRAKYYSLDVKEVKMYTNKVVEDPKPEVKKAEVKPKKQGFFSRLFGGNKNNSSKTENQNPAEEGSENSSNSDNYGSNNYEEDVIENGDSDARNGGNYGESGYGSDLDRDEDSYGRDEAPVYGEGEDYDDEFSSESSNSDDLSLGDFGGQHVDTGFLDDDAREEIISDLSMYGIDEDTSFEGDFADPNEEGRGKLSEAYNKVKNKKMTLISSPRGAGVTTFIVDTALNLRDQSYRVLIVDLDYRENGILSFIDANRFYEDDAERGIELGKVYEEDGVVVISNGYGRGINTQDLTELLSGISSGDDFDYVLLDCPLDCLDCVSEEALEVIDQAILIANGNKGSLTSLIGVLTSSKIEDYLYSKSSLFVVNRVNEYNEDIEFLKNTLLFGREDWLSKIE